MGSVVGNKDYENGNSTKVSEKFSSELKNFRKNWS